MKKKMIIFSTIMSMMLSVQPAIQLYAATSTTLQQSVVEENFLATMKQSIETATSNITLTIPDGVYTFSSTGVASIVNNNNINVTLNGSGNVTLIMGADVASMTRFISIPNGSLTVSGITFQAETPKRNGGIEGNNVTATNCKFINNYGNLGNVSGGGGIRVRTGDLNVDNCEFIGNSCAPSGDGGAISAMNAGNVRITNSIFEGNYIGGNSNQYGGAVSIKQPGKSSTILIQNCSFNNNTNTNNSTSGGSRGGAVHIYTTNKVSSVLIDNVLFSGNSCTTNNGGGLAIVASSRENTPITVQNSTFLNNSSGKYGGGLYFENAPYANVINSTFVGNQSSVLNSGLFTYQTEATADSCTFIASNIGAMFGTPSPSGVVVKNSIVADATVGSNINYVLQKTDSSAPYAESQNLPATAPVFSKGITAGEVFENGNQLTQINVHNFVAPIIQNGSAYGKISGSRPMASGQNDLPRKSPYSDIGAFESPNATVMYTVQFESNYPNPENKAPNQSVAAGNYATAPIGVTRSGYTLEGWATDTAGTTMWNFATTPVNGNLILYAVWKEKGTNTDFVVRFESNGGSDVPSQTVPSGGLVKRVSNPTKPDSCFYGWYVDEECTIRWNFGTDRVYSDMTLYALWCN